MDEIATVLGSERGLAFGMLVLVLVALGWAVRGWLQEKDRRADDKDRYAQQILEMSRDGIQAQHATQTALAALTTLLSQGRSK